MKCENTLYVLFMVLLLYVLFMVLLLLVMLLLLLIKLEKNLPLNIFHELQPL